MAALAEPASLPAIVYAGTRGATDQLAASLARGLGERVVAYHAGMDRERPRRRAGAVHERATPR